MRRQIRLLLKQLLPFLICLGIVLVSALAVLAMDRLEERKALRLDFSFNSITTQNELTEKVLKGLKYPVHAYALSSPGMEDRALLGLLNRLASLSPNFTYSPENLVQNPMLANTLSSSLKDGQVTSESLILQCKDTGRTRVLQPYQYLEQQFDPAGQDFVISGISYEKSIVEALVYLTMETVPSIRILTGHGEIGETDTAYMEEFLESHHFDVKRVNLMSGQELNPQDLLMILSPQKDLMEAELTLLNAFSNAGGAMLVTSDYSDPDSLPRFDALYRQMGMARKAGIVIAEGADLSAYIDNPLFLTPYMDMTEPTAELIGAGQTRLRLPGARALDIVSMSDMARVEPLLTTGQAYLKTVEQANESLAREDGNEEGQFFVALLSDYAHPNGTHARAMMIGNSAILLDSWLHEVTYGAQFLLHMANYLSVSEPINLDIAPKALVREQLNIKNPLPAKLILIALPLLTAGVAVPILLKRSRKQHAAGS